MRAIFSGKDDDLCALSGEGRDLGDVGADKVHSGGSLREEMLVGRDEGDGDPRRGWGGSEAVEAVSEDSDKDGGGESKGGL